MKAEVAFSKIEETDGDLQLVYGEVYAPLIPDAENDFMTAEEIRKTAHDFMAKQRTQQIDIMHNNQVCGAYVVESFIARENDPDYAEGAWVICVHVPDQHLWQDIKDGVFNGFSMEIRGYATPVELELEIPEVIEGETTEVEGHTHRYFVRYAEDGTFLGGYTDEIEGHSHEIKHGTFTTTDGSASIKPHRHNFAYLEVLKDSITYKLEPEDEQA